MNINRDYLIINDVKKSNIQLANDSMFFYITDKNTQNIFVNLVINVSKNDLIQKYANIENAEDYTLTMNIVKPDNTYKIIEGKLHDKEKAIFEFDLKEDCVDKIGTYKCELLTKCNINDHEEITTSNKLTYKVKSSILNNLDDIVNAPEYPLVIQLFDKLSDIEQYEEDRRANELARQLAEEQRQTRFDVLDSDMVDRITAMDDKMVDVENRIVEKEEAVDTLIADTKADINEYKVAKDQEIDEYKSAKDTEINNAIANQDNKINNAITNQDNKIDTAINAQNDRITVVENNDVAQDNRLDVLENRATQHESRLTDVEAKNTVQDNRLDIVENKNTQQDNRLNDIEAKNVEQDNRLDDIEAIDVAQNTRLDAIEVKNQQQDDRLLDIEKVNKRQDMNLKCLFAESKNNMIDITEEGNSIYLQNSTIGYTLIDEIKGNTLVNCNKEPDKELILNGNINTSGDNAVTITEGVDGGLVDVSLEGNTLVNVSKTKDPIAITEAYTVENSGNHIALQGEVDGSCRPVITGNTLVNLFDKSINWEGDAYKSLKFTRVTNGTFTFKAEIGDKSSNANDAVLGIAVKNKNDNTERSLYSSFSNGHGNLNLVFTLTEEEYLCITAYDIVDDKFYKNYPKPLILEGDYTDKSIPDYFEGLQSTFEDNLVTQEMIDSGEEVADNLGKYRVDYKVTGKNKAKNPLYLKDNEYNPCVKAVVNLKPNTTYTLSLIVPEGQFFIADYTKTFSERKGILGDGTRKSIVLTTRKDIVLDRLGRTYIFFNETNYSSDGTASDLMIEEGSTATAYEPYKEYTKTLYLNSPLLEGDTIEEKDGGIYHVHRSEEIVFDGSDDEDWSLYTSMAYEDSTCISLKIPNKIKADAEDFSDLICDKLQYVKAGYSNNSTNISSYVNDIYRNNHIYIRIMNAQLSSSDKQGVIQWIQQNPLTVVYQLETPTYELIEQSNLAIPSYANGHLDFNTAVPVEKVEFKPFSEQLTYLYANTQYTVQFVSDKAITADITLGGTSLLAQSIVAGLNRISITTPGTLADNKLIISGVGANISEVVVTDTDREFRYFEGMKSVGECEELEVASNNKNLWNWDDMYNQYGTTSANVYKKFNGTLTRINDNEYSITPYQGGWYEQGIFSTPVYLKQGESLTFSGECSHFANITIYNLSNFLSPCSSVLENPDTTLDDFIQFAVSYTAQEDGYYVCRFWIWNNQTAICKNIQVEKSSQATSYISHQSNAQQLTHEPLRSIGTVKDRYIMIDGKWYIERNCKQENMSELRFAGDTSDTMKCLILYKSKPKAISNIFSNSRGFESATKGQMYVQERGSGITYLWIPTDSMSREEFTSFLNEKNATIVYALTSPVYEPIDHNPLEVYTGTTHITTNSTIPTNVVVKNHGYNCLLKPSTTYTVSSNLGLNTVTTPSTLTEDCLRFMDTDTSDVTTMKNVLVLEGDWTSKADLIPSNFSGIESAFEQELVTDENDEHFGKYRVNAKVVGKNLFDENSFKEFFSTYEHNYKPYKIMLRPNTTYTFSDKTGKWNACMFFLELLDDDEKVIAHLINTNTGNRKSFTFTTNSSKTFYLRMYTNDISKMFNISSDFMIEQGDTATAYEPYKENNITFYINEPLRGVGDVKDKVYIKDDKVVVQRNCGIRPYEDGDFGTYLTDKVNTVYQLAEPVYEEVEYNDTKLFIESFKNSTLSYNSNVPVTSKLYYSYSVPLVDTVAQTANISDEQDVMIIDLATQVAVMEMMLM